MPVRPNRIGLLPRIPVASHKRGETSPLVLQKLQPSAVDDTITNAARGSAKYKSRGTVDESIFIDVILDHPTQPDTQTLPPNQIFRGGTILSIPPAKEPYILEIHSNVGWLTQDPTNAGAAPLPATFLEVGIVTEDASLTLDGSEQDLPLQDIKNSLFLNAVCGDCGVIQVEKGLIIDPSLNDKHTFIYIGILFWTNARNAVKRASLAGQIQGKYWEKDQQIYDPTRR